MTSAGVEAAASAAMAAEAALVVAAEALAATHPSWHSSHCLMQPLSQQRIPPPT